MSQPPLTFPIEEIRSFFHGMIPSVGTSSQDAVGFLRSSNNPYFYTLSWLNGRVETITADTGGIDSNLLKIWRVFYSTVQNPQYPAHFPALALDQIKRCYIPDQDLGYLSDTDLRLYSNIFRRDELPLNGILKEDLPSLEELYKAFVSHVLIAGDENFKAIFLRDLRIILSRPTSRALIARLVQGMDPDVRFDMYQSDESGFRFDGSRYVINISTDRDNMIQKLPNGEEKTLFIPSFMVLVHELIHFLNHLEQRDNHIDAYGKPEDPTLNELDTNREERYVIYGNCGTDLIPGCHEPTEINENQIRREHGFLERVYHAAEDPTASIDKKFAFAVRYNIRGDLEEFAPKISPNEIDQVLFDQMLAEPSLSYPNPRGSIEKLIELAVQKKIPRVGYLERIQTPPPSAMESDQKEETLNPSFP